MPHAFLKAWAVMVRRPTRTAEKWLTSVGSGLVTFVVVIMEMVLTDPRFAAALNHVGLVVPIPPQPIGYVDGWNLGMMLATVIGALLGYAIGHGIYRCVWPTLHRQR